MRTFLKAIDRWRYRSLLGMLIGALFLQPILHHLPAGSSILIVVFAVIFAGAIRVTSPVASIAGFGIGVTLLWAAVSLASTHYESAWLTASALMITVLLAALVIWRTLEALLLEDQADRDTLAGAVFGYLLWAVLWGEIYVALELWQPGSFAVSDKLALGSEMLYFSLVSITTLGYGDVLPLKSFPRVLAGLEAVFGTLYIAVLIGRIVGALRRPGARPDASDGEASES